MKKLFSLIKASLNHDMNIFKINTKRQNKFFKILLPIILVFYIMFIFIGFSGAILDALKPIKMEFVLLTLFSFSVSILTFIEGVYKSSGLLFNCKDDDLLLSLPIKKSTVLFIRVLKFYIFELIYNSLFLLPAIFVYAVNMLPNWTYYLSSFFALLLLPIIPVAVSCIFGFIISYLSSKFKGKNIIQTIFTMILFLGIFYLSSNMDGLVNSIASKASSMNDFIVKLYYPAGTYIKLVNDFNIKDLLLFIIINVLIFVLIVFILGKIYFKINSSTKRVLSNNKNKKYFVRNSSPIKAIIKKEINKFFKTPVYILNAGFGLVLFLLACIGISLKFENFISPILTSDPTMTIQKIEYTLPVLMLLVVCFISLMTSITSSMISFEGKSFNILKSLPIKPIRIINAKILAALLIILPCILIGDIIIFIRFKFDFISILLLLLASFILPLMTEVMGMLFNLKYPKMNASNDTEVVKQSMSTIASTFVGMGLAIVTSFLVFGALDKNISNNIIMLIVIFSYTVISMILIIILNKKGDKYFNNINI